MKQTHKRCAYFSNLIYNPLVVMESDNSETFEFDNIKFGIFNEASTNYVVFQGSNDLEDWLTNFTVTKTDIGFHSGFADSAASIKDILLAELDSNKTYAFTGHSMGGALALILGMELNAAEIVTFGQPRVLSNSSIVEYDTSKIYRYVTPEDVIPNTPPTMFGYTHIGQSRFILDAVIHTGEMSLYDTAVYKVYTSAKESASIISYGKNPLVTLLHLLILFTTLQVKRTYDSHDCHTYYDKLCKPKVYE